MANCYQLCPIAARAEQASSIIFAATSLRHRIEPAGISRMAPAYSLDRQPAALPKAVFPNRLLGVLRARRVKTTSAGEEGRDQLAICRDEPERQRTHCFLFYRPTYFPANVKRQELDRWQITVTPACDAPVPGVFGRRRSAKTALPTRETLRAAHHKAVH